METGRSQPPLSARHPSALLRRSWFGPRGFEHRSAASPNLMMFIEASRLSPPSTPQPYTDEAGSDLGALSIDRQPASTCLCLCCFDLLCSRWHHLPPPLGPTQTKLVRTSGHWAKDTNSYEKQKSYGYGWCRRVAPSPPPPASAGRLNDTEVQCETPVQPIQYLARCCMRVGGFGPPPLGPTQTKLVRTSGL